MSLTYNPMTMPSCLQQALGSCPWLCPSAASPPPRGRHNGCREGRPWSRRRRSWDPQGVNRFGDGSTHVNFHEIHFFFGIWRWTSIFRTSHFNMLPINAYQEISIPIIPRFSMIPYDPCLAFVHGIFMACVSFSSLSFCHTFICYKY